jgi:shikimate dehydrogenase
MISAQTRLYGLIGHPVRHSLSPAMYNELFRRFGLDARYLAFDVDPRRSDRVSDAIRTLDLVGVNLTVPFKERVLPQLDHMTQAAREAGAVNVVICVDGWLTGYNTDGEGLLRSLLESGVRDLSERRVVVLGAGGTARAVAAALLDRGVPELVMLNRSTARAEAAVEALTDVVPSARLTAAGLEPHLFSQHARGARLVINCTAGPAGPRVAQLDPGVLGPNATWVDANYWMEEPPLQAACAHLGVSFHTGHSMLMHQGALAFELFSGHPVEAAEIREFMPARIQAS